MRSRLHPRLGRDARRLLSGALIAAALGGALGAGVSGSDSRADETTSGSTTRRARPAAGRRRSSTGRRVRPRLATAQLQVLPLVVALYVSAGQSVGHARTDPSEQVADEHQQLRRRFPRVLRPSASLGPAFGPRLRELDDRPAHRQPKHRPEPRVRDRVSAGGYETWLTACELSAKVAAVAIVSGAMNGALYHACTPARPIPQLLMVGDSDGILWTGIETCTSRPQTPCLPSAAETTARWRQIDHCPATQPSMIQRVSAVEQETWSACTDGSVVAEYIVHGAGHVWPPIGTGAPSDYSASEAVWAFFSNLHAAPLTIGKDATAGPIVVKRSGKKRTITATISLKEPRDGNGDLGHDSLPDREQGVPRHGGPPPGEPEPPHGNKGRHVRRLGRSRRFLRAKAHRHPSGSRAEPPEATAEEETSSQADADQAEDALSLLRPQPWLLALVLEEVIA